MAPPNKAKGFYPTGTWIVKVLERKDYFNASAVHHNPPPGSAGLRSGKFRDEFRHLCGLKPLRIASWDRHVSGEGVRDEGERGRTGAPAPDWGPAALLATRPGADWRPGVDGSPDSDGADRPAPGRGDCVDGLRTLEANEGFMPRASTCPTVAHPHTSAGSGPRGGWGPLEDQRDPTG